MKKLRKFMPVLPLVVVAAAVGHAPGAVAVEDDVDRIMRAMGDYLKNANEMNFHADISYDAVLSTGEKVKYGTQSDISVRRPDRLLVTSIGDESSKQVFFDGSTITLFNTERNLYAVTEVPSQLDVALDIMFEKFGLVVPLADFLYADPYAVLMENVQFDSVIGEHACGVKRCHHLLFTQEAIDWQIWIETGPHPVPRRLVITYKSDPGAPQWEAWFSRWNFQPRLSEHAFTFHPPDGAYEIEFLPEQAEETDR
jgi:hypothetical protein